MKFRFFWMMKSKLFHHLRPSESTSLSRFPKKSIYQHPMRCQLAVCYLCKPATPEPVRFFLLFCFYGNEHRVVTSLSFRRFPLSVNIIPISFPSSSSSVLHPSFLFLFPPSLPRAHTALCLDLALTQ